MLPVVTLALPLAGIYYRVLRADLLQTLRSDHITFARAMGMSPLYLSRDGHWPDPTAPGDLDPERVAVISDLRGVLDHV